MKKIITLIILFISIISFGQNKEYKKAVNLFNDKKYTEANVIIEKLLNKEYGDLDEVTELYTLNMNLNCYIYANDFKTAYTKAEVYFAFIKNSKNIWDEKNKNNAITETEKIITDLKLKIPQDSNSKSDSKITSESNSQAKTETTETKVAETAKPASDDKTVTLTVSGTGKTLEEARLNALRSAIEQAFGAFISSKTEILNDKVVADQIASVANGNIQSYSILNESQLPDKNWAVSLKALVSINKLISFVEAKGIAIEIKGGIFALNIKQQLLNEQGEIKAVSEMVGLLHEIMQISFDYDIKSSDPKSLDAESKNWEIPLVITAIANKNMDFCAKYLINTLEALSLSSEEVSSYQSLNKIVFPIDIKYNGVAKKYYLRKESSINVLNSLTSNWEFYTRSFIVQSGMDESNGKGKGQIHDFTNSLSYKNDVPTINFLTLNEQAATFSLEDKRTLAQIEQMTGYKVKPSGVVSHFKCGGFVVNEENNHGLVVAMIDLDRDMDWNSAKTACDELVLNGYVDWRLPTKDELNNLYVNLKQLGIGNFKQQSYWSSTEYNYGNAWEQYFFGKPQGGVSVKGSKYFVRAVRAF